MQICVSFYTLLPEIVFYPLTKYPPYFFKIQFNFFSLLVIYITVTCNWPLCCLRSNLLSFLRLEMSFEHNRNSFCVVIWSSERLLKEKLRMSYLLSNLDFCHENTSLYAACLNNEGFRVFELQSLKKSQALHVLFWPIVLQVLSVYHLLSGVFQKKYLIDCKSYKKFRFPNWLLDLVDQIYPTFVKN